MSPMKAEDIEGVASAGILDSEIDSSSSSEKSTVNRWPRKSIFDAGMEGSAERSGIFEASKFKVLRFSVIKNWD